MIRRGGRPRRAATVIAATLALAGCGDGDTEIGGGTSAEDTAITLEVSSPDLDDGSPIAAAFTCDGADEPPRLTWSDAPDGTAEVVVVVDDPDAPGGTFLHWGVWGLAPTATSLERPLPAGVVQATNDLGEVGYAGPCPPEGDEPHTYRFRVLALDTRIDLPDGATAEELADAVDGRVLASGELTATYGR